MDFSPNVLNVVRIAYCRAYLFIQTGEMSTKNPVDEGFRLFYRIVRFIRYIITYSMLRDFAHYVCDDAHYPDV